MFIYKDPGGGGGGCQGLLESLRSASSVQWQVASIISSSGPSCYDDQMISSDIFINKFNQHLVEAGPDDRAEVSPVITRNPSYFSSTSPPAKPSQQMHCVCSRCLLPLKMCKTYERIMYDASTFYTSSALEEKPQILVSLSSGLCIHRHNLAGGQVYFT